MKNPSPELFIDLSTSELNMGVEPKYAMNWRSGKEF